MRNNIVDLACYFECLNSANPKESTTCTLITPYLYTLFVLQEWFSIYSIVLLCIIGMTYYGFTASKSGQHSNTETQYHNMQPADQEYACFVIWFRVEGNSWPLAAKITSWPTIFLVVELPTHASVWAGQLQPTHCLSRATVCGNRVAKSLTQCMNKLHQHFLITRPGYAWVATI